MPDKILHCLARTLQDEIIGDCVKCLYCKYAPECRNEIINGTPLFVRLLRLLYKFTSVKIELNQETKAEDIVKGSWIEKYPDVLKELTNKSFDEQQDILRDSDILRYMDN